MVAMISAGDVVAGPMRRLFHGGLAVFIVAIISVFPVYGTASFKSA
jgi:hypothetical protein